MDVPRHDDLSGIPGITLRQARWLGKALGLTLPTLAAATPVELDAMVRRAPPQSRAAGLGRVPDLAVLETWIVTARELVISTEAAVDEAPAPSRTAGPDVDDDPDGETAQEVPSPGGDRAPPYVVNAHAVLEGDAPGPMHVIPRDHPWTVVVTWEVTDPGRLAVGDTWVLDLAFRPMGHAPVLAAATARREVEVATDHADWCERLVVPSGAAGDARQAVAYVALALIAHRSGSGSRLVAAPSIGMVQFTGGGA